MNNKQPEANTETTFTSLFRLWPVTIFKMTCQIDITNPVDESTRYYAQKGTFYGIKVGRLSISVARGV